MMCPVCGGAELRPVLDIAQVPVFCNQLCDTPQEALAVARGDMSIRHCAGCHHLFNAAFDSKLVEYSPKYENTLHCSGQFQRYAGALTGELAERYDLAKRCVVEVGCGNGQFLRDLCAASGAHGIGFDPSYQGPTGAVSDNVVIHRQRLARALVPGEPALICCRHCLEHVDEPVPFLRSLGSEVAPHTRVFFEVPNALYTVRDGGIWDILYEHCGYFTAGSLREAFQRAGFEADDVAVVFAGQFLTLHGHVGSALSTGPTLNDQVSEGAVVAEFADLYARKTQTYRERLAREREAGRRVAIWGGGTKGVMFLNTVGTGDEVVVDINPKKQGKFVAGTGQPIVAPKALSELRPDLVVVMNPVYRDEIASTLGELGLTPELLEA